MNIPRPVSVLATIALAVFGLTIPSLRAVTQQHDSTLDRLINDSDVIVAAEVTKSSTPATLSPTGEHVPTLVAEFRLLEVLRGQHKKDDIVSLPHSRYAGRFTRGEVVMLFLKGPGNYGLFSTAGQGAGVFWTAAGTDPNKRLLVNLDRNSSLWKGKSLWSQSTFDRQRAEDYLRSSSPTAVAHASRIRSDADRDRIVEYVLAFGDRPSEEGPLPLDFLLSAVYSRLKE